MWEGQPVGWAGTLRPVHDRRAAPRSPGGSPATRSSPNGRRPASSRPTAEGGLNPDAFFLIEAGGLDRSSPLRKAAEAAKAAAAIVIYDDETGDVARMVREALAKDRVGLTPEALDLFVARLPRERGVARQEIERLALVPLGPGSNTVRRTGRSYAPPGGRAWRRA